MPNRDQLKSLLRDEQAVIELRKRFSGHRFRAIDVNDEEGGILEQEIGYPVPEKVVLQQGRPSLYVRGDSYEEPALDTWNERLANARQSIQRVLPSVGRVELRNHPTFDWNGTAWMIGPSVMVTNRHVAMLFAERRNSHFVFRANPSGRIIKAAVDLKEEHGLPDERELTIREILHIEEDRSDCPDIAFIKVDIPDDGLPLEPIPLATSEPDSQDLVAVIGYPSFDPDELPSVARRIFEGVYAVKRLSPGMIINPNESDSFSFTHDCTTMGGSSGSVVISLTTGEALGLHYAGVSRAANYAIHAATLQRLYRQYCV